MVSHAHTLGLVGQPDGNYVVWPSQNIVMTISGMQDLTKSILAQPCLVSGCSLEQGWTERRFGEVQAEDSAVSGL